MQRITMKQDKRIDRAWNQMEDLLNEKMPSKRKPMLWPLWFIVFVSIAIFSSKWVKDWDSEPTSTNSSSEMTMPLNLNEKYKAEEAFSEPPASESSSTRIANNEKAKFDMPLEDKEEIKSLKKLNHKKKGKTHPIPVMSHALEAEGVADVPDSRSNKLIDDKESERVPLKEQLKAHYPPDKLIPVERIAFNRALAELEYIRPKRPLIIDNRQETEDPESGNSPIQFSLMSYAEYIIDFSVTGGGVAFAMNKSIQPRWDMGIKMNYSLTSSSASDELRGGIETAGDLPDIENPSVDLETEAFAGTALDLLKERTEELSSFGLSLFTSYQATGNVSVFGGAGMEYYSRQLELVPQAEENIDSGFNSSGVSYSLEEGPHSQFFLDIGLNYQLINKLSVSAHYRYGLNAFYSEAGQNLHLNKIQAGLLYNF